MEGTIRREPNVPLVVDGQLHSLLASKRDGQRYGVAANGSAIGGISQIPISGCRRLVLEPTTSTLVSLLDGESALMPYLIAGQDVTQAGDIGMPVIVMLHIDPMGQVIGSYANCMIHGNLYQVLGDDFHGVSTERSFVAPEDPFFLCNMNVSVQ